tara:strand:+ start:3828 stop:5024 length:1197 start_codon:yes stop_codon:yes gene_type:complete
MKIYNQINCCCKNYSKKNYFKIKFNNLPLTESYAKKFNKNHFKANQVFNFCKKCKHGFLGNIINPKKLYNNVYYFRTSKSKTSSAGSDFFLKFLNSNQKKKKKICLDIGCNDFYVLNKLNKTKIKIGIDPIQKNFFKKNFYSYGGNYEDIDLGNFYKKIDLVVCRHTLEHIVNLDLFFKKLFEDTSNDCEFFFEFPSLDLLIENYRFDQIFHQHVHYFSLQSIKKCISKYGFELNNYKFNQHHWGALLIHFSKKKNKAKKNKSSILIKKNIKEGNKKINILEIQNRYNIFLQNMINLKNVLNKIEKKKLYFYGASQMLPVLLYHLDIDIKLVNAIIDDDKSKKNMSYNNVDLKIDHLKINTNINDLSFLVTAPDNAAAITKKLIKLRPKKIFNMVRSI